MMVSSMVLNMVFETVRSAAKDWRTVEQADQQRALARGKPGDGDKAFPRQSRQEQKKTSR